MFDIEFFVDYSDTDAMGVVHHSNYFRWFERARVAWFRHLRMPYSEMEKQELYLPLRSAQIEYIKPLYFEDKVRVVVKAREVGKVDVTVDVEVYRGNELTTRAHTHHVLCFRSVDPTTGREKWAPRRIPQEWREKWQQQNAKKS